MHRKSRIAIGRAVIADVKSVYTEYLRTEIYEVYFEKGKVKLPNLKEIKAKL